jgi:hypothetical protein
MFEMTPAAELLRRDNPSSLRSTAMLYGDDVLWRAYGQLSRAIEIGKPAFDHVYGQPLYDYLDQHPVPAALFHEAMTGFRNRKRSRSSQRTTSPHFDASLISAADKVR